jgi:acetolactate synthase-1/2/3 large subunit
MKGAQAVVECLVEEGVEIVFGYPGGMILPLYDALYDDTRIQQILTTHEQSAAHAADGYARASGKVGVCIATSGPGATNLVTGIATAFMDSIPLVAITGQVDTTLLGRDAFQETDIIGVTMSVTKHNFKVKDPKKLISTLRLAFQTAKSGRPGPVLVDIPRDLFFAETVFEAPSASKVFAKPAADFLICVAEAAEVIQKANRPVIIAGGGVISAGASRELCLFAEKFNLPVANTLMGISAFPQDHKLSLGFAGMHGLKTANNAIAEADLIIAVGSRFGDRQTGNRDKYTRNTHFIHIDIDPAELDKNVASSIGLAGNMKVILTLLMQYEPLRSLDRWWNVLQGWQDKYKRDYDGTYLNVPWAMDCINQLSKDKHIAIATDVGQHQMWAAQHLRLQEPRTWISSGGLGTMGFGLPAALGAQLAFGKSRRLIHIAGDGGIKMTGNEYYTIARLNLPIISILINNSSLGMIRQLQKVQYNERYIACDMTYPMDYVLYAKSFGIEGAEVSTPDEFRQALQKAFLVDRPRVIVLTIKHEFVQPMIKYGAEINEFVEF